MNSYNCIIILNKEKDRLLFCKRANDPYQGQEKHPLFWLDFSRNFFDRKTFAGEGNIGHMIEILKMSEL